MFRHIYSGHYISYQNVLTKDAIVTVIMKHLISSHTYLKMDTPNI